MAESLALRRPAGRLEPRRIVLPTGLLDVSVAHADWPLDMLCGFAARDNPKRGFLVVSKVLGRHIGARPDLMRQAARDLAAKLPHDLPGPVLVVGLAETAICLGQTVHEEWRALTGRDDLFFIHSTRQRFDEPLLCRFEEPHSHASAHLIYAPQLPSFDAPRSLVLVDDEISTGTTLANLGEVLIGCWPQVEAIALATLTNWSDNGWRMRMPRPASCVSLLSGTARMGWLNRMTQWKDKAGKNREGSSVALFTYPVLQAADVLLYQATHVPVGEDQKQHLELARDIATKFNLDFETELFTLPEPLVSRAAPRIMSLRDGAAKMSKSDPSDLSRVNLNDPDDLIAQKVRKARTDAEPLPQTMAELDGRPEAKNLVTIYAALADRAPADVLSEFAGQGFGQFKPALADFMIAVIGPIRGRLDALTADPAAVTAALVDGAMRARALGAPTLAAAHRAIGLQV